MAVVAKKIRVSDAVWYKPWTWGKCHYYTPLSMLELAKLVTPEQKKRGEKICQILNTKKELLEGFPQSDS